jgi:C-terminal processing protease CtpA/Prc
MPIVILVDENTISAAETFVICFMSTTKCYIIGKPSEGSATFPLIVKLQLGAYAKIATQQIYYNNSKFDFIKPDLELEPTINEILKDIDVVFNRALDYINEL